MKRANLSCGDMNRPALAASCCLPVILLGLFFFGCQDKKPAPAKNLRPIIDSHVHVTPLNDSVARAIEIFDKNGITKFCTKSAGFVGSGRFNATLRVKQQLGERFAFFCNLDWRGIDNPAWPEREAMRLARAAQLGARGLKIFKNLGLGVRTADGKLLAVDDPRLDPIMQKAAELGMIVALHTTDPKVFFDKPDPANERYMELLFAPSWSFYGKDFPTRATLFEARNRLLAKHPKTTFLGIHLANNPEDIDYVDKLLDDYPNLYVDISARIPEIGRHPAEKVRRFFIKHQNRILFGSDIVVSPGRLQLGSLSILPDDDSDADRFFQAHREFFETDHKHIDHPTPIQGYWTVDAIKLPEDVLQKFYVENAQILIWKKK
ncbi:MAG: amidohydrolase family protein [Deltaproteobacteria bacterium]|nr:amidohydrolase family protein [Deltaproteobacteria bacterium]